jgi:hypothetical protein
VLITKVRIDERSAPEPLATLQGQVTSSPSGGEFLLTGPPTQSPDLGEIFERGGHRRPRRRLFLSIGDQPQLTLLLPDTMQVRSGFMEVTAKLTVNGEVHADETQNEILDVPLLPPELTHAVFHFVDSKGEALAQRTIDFETSGGEPVTAVTDDFGEVYLDGSLGQRYTVTEILPAGDAPVAVVETRVIDGASAVA